MVGRTGCAPSNGRWRDVVRPGCAGATRLVFDSFDRQCEYVNSFAVDIAAICGPVYLGCF